MQTAPDFQLNLSGVPCSHARAAQENQISGVVILERALSDDARR